MSNDTELLRQYASERSESAFAELVRLHLNLVYSAALREMAGDTALAEDLSQSVFSELAAKAQRLVKHPSLAGWLYTTVRLLGANLRRAEFRRRRREEEACKMDTPVDEQPELAWQQIAPALDDALHELNEADRAALVLRFLEERSLRDVGASLGLNENTARMRVDRALDKLRGLLARRGITSTTSGLTVALAVGAITPAPSGLAATIATTALAGSTVTTSTTLTIIKIMSGIKLKAALASTLIIAVAVPVWQQQQRNRLESEIAQLRRQTAELAPLREEVERLRKVEVDRGQLEELTKWKAQVEPELLRLRGKSGAAQQAQSQLATMRAQLAKQQSEGETNQLAGAMGDMMKNMMEQQVTTKVARMTEKLKLTPDQAHSITDILMRQAQATSAGMQQIFSGKSNRDEIAQLAREGNPEEKIKALLTPGQLEDYKTYQEEEKSSTARMAVTAELMQMQALGLTADQQERVSSILYDLNTKQLSGSQPPPATGDKSDIMQWTLDQKAKALETVLTPTQMESYRKQQEIQIKFARDIMSKMGPKGTP